MRQPGCPTWSLRTRGFHSPPYPASSGQYLHWLHTASDSPGFTGEREPLRRRAEPTFLSAGSLRSAGMSFQSCPSCRCTYPKGPASLSRRGRYGNPTRFPRFLSAVRGALENAFPRLAQILPGPGYNNVTSFYLCCGAPSSQVPFTLTWVTRVLLVDTGGRELVIRMRVDNKLCLIIIALDLSSWLKVF